MARKKVNEEVIFWINVLLIFFVMILFLLIFSTNNKELFDEEFYVKVVNKTNNQSFYAVCFSWSECFENNTQYRLCYSLNDLAHPLIQERYCNYQEYIHCFDGKKDFDETDIDCGGSCKSCQLYKHCKVDRDCASGNCHPLLKKCVTSDEMPNFLLRMIYRHPIIMFFVLIIFPFSILYLVWLKSSLEESKKIIQKKDQELIEEFNSYARIFRENVKNGNIDAAKDVFLEINRVLDEMSENAIKKVMKEYNAIKKIYYKISKISE